MASDGFSSWALRFFLLGETVLFSFAAGSWPSSWYRPLSIRHPAVWVPFLAIVTTAAFVVHFSRSRGAWKTCLRAAITAGTAVLVQWALFAAVSSEQLVLPSYRKDFGTIFPLTYGCFVVLTIVLAFLREEQSRVRRSTLTDVGVALVVWSLISHVRTDPPVLEIASALVIAILVVSAAPARNRNASWMGLLITTLCAAAALRLTADRTTLLLFVMASAALSMWIGARIPLTPSEVAIGQATPTTR